MSTPSLFLTFKEVDAEIYRRLMHDFTVALEDILDSKVEAFYMAREEGGERSVIYAIPTGKNVTLTKIMNAVNHEKIKQIVAGLDDTARAGLTEDPQKRLSYVENSLN